MTTLFAPDHLFTRLLAEHDARIAAEQADQERRQQNQAQADAQARQSLYDNMAALLGPEFMAAIEPYITHIGVWSQSCGLTAHIDLPDHDTITLYYNPHRKQVEVATSGLATTRIIPGNMAAFAPHLRQARERFAKTAADAARQAAWREWEDARDHVNQANAAALQVLQQEMDEEFTLWELTYALVVYDADDYDQLLGAESVMVLHPSPDAAGWWSVVNQRDGSVQKRRFFHEVSLGAPQTLRASDRQYSQYVSVDSYGIVGYLSPTAPHNRIAEYRRRAAALITPIPDRPHDAQEENCPF